LRILLEFECWFSHPYCGYNCLGCRASSQSIRCWNLSIITPLYLPFSPCLRYQILLWTLRDYWTPVVVSRTSSGFFSYWYSRISDSDRFWNVDSEIETPLLRIPKTSPLPYNSYKLLQDCNMIWGNGLFELNHVVSRSSVYMAYHFHTRNNTLL